MEENASIVAYLSLLLDNLESETRMLTDLACDASADQITNATRNICLASRSAFSEFMALHIDRVLSGNGELDRVFALHHAALAGLERLPAPNKTVSEFMEAIRSRTMELMTLRRQTFGSPRVAVGSATPNLSPT